MKFKVCGVFFWDILCANLTFKMYCGSIAFVKIIYIQYSRKKNGNALKFPQTLKLLNFYSSKSSYRNSMNSSKARKWNCFRMWIHNDKQATCSLESSHEQIALCKVGFFLGLAPGNSKYSGKATFEDPTKHSLFLLVFFHEILHLAFQHHYMVLGRQKWILAKATWRFLCLMTWKVCSLRIWELNLH